MEQFEKCAAGAAHHQVAELVVQQSAGGHFHAVTEVPLNDHLRHVGRALERVAGAAHRLLAPEIDVDCSSLTVRRLNGGAHGRDHVAAGREP
jgi:hypothetical protein